MSNQRITTGVFARLKKPVGDLHTPEWDSTNDGLYDRDTGLFLGYNGQIILMRDTDQESYDVGLIIPDVEGMKEKFKAALAAEGIEIFEGSIKVFFDYWYDGADSNHVDMSMKEAGYLEEQ